MKGDLELMINLFKFMQPQMLVLMEKLHSFVLQGKSECHVFEAAPSCTGGKVFKNCNHQVRMCMDAFMCGIHYNT